MNELKEPEIQKSGIHVRSRQLRNSDQNPSSFHMHLQNPSPSSLVRTRQSRDSLSLLSPRFQPTVNVVFIRVNQAPSLDCSEDRALSFSSGHLHIESPSPFRSIMPKTGGFSLSNVPRPGAPANDSPSLSSFRSAGGSFCPATTTPRHIQPLHKALFRAFFYNALTQLCGHLSSVRFRSSSWAIWILERLRPMK